MKPDSMHRKPSPGLLLTGAALLLGGAIALQCSAPHAADSTSAPDPARAPSAAAWATVYRVLQHPRCLNCHPAGDLPLQGEDSHAHAQNVQRGADGEGLYAMRCTACHSTSNAPGAHLPPGAPHWKLPRAAMPLVFEGRSSAELCRQLADTKQNGGRSPAELLHHVRDDALVRWGWSPGEGRASVPVPFEEFVLAMKTWVDAGCGCP